MVQTAADGYVHTSDLCGAKKFLTEKKERRSKEKRVEFLVKHLDDFFLMGNQMEKGLVTFAISSCSEGKCYQLTPTEWSDEILVADDTVAKARMVVAPIEKRTPVSGWKVCRAIFSQSYWINENNKATLLLDHYGAFDLENVIEAFTKLMHLKYGRRIKELAPYLGWVMVDGRKRLAWLYEHAEGEFLACLVLSGSIMTSDKDQFEVKEAEEFKARKVFNLGITKLVWTDKETLKFY